MVRMQVVVAAVLLVVSCASVEARGRRMVWQQPVYNQYYSSSVPTYSVPATTVAAQAPVTPPAVSGTVVQMSGTASGSVTQANAVATQVAPTAGPATTATANTVASTPGSAQWKAEQSARLGSVQHLGGGFGGGSFEGNGFGATPEQAIQNCCFWGQRTPIQIGVARGVNGYYATVFYQ